MRSIHGGSPSLPLDWTTMQMTPYRRRKLAEALGYGKPYDPWWQAVGNPSGVMHVVWKITLPGGDHVCKERQATYRKEVQEH